MGRLDEDRRERRDDQKVLHKRIDTLGQTMGRTATEVSDMGKTLTGVAVKVDGHGEEIDRLRNRVKSTPPPSVTAAATDAARHSSWKAIAAAITGFVTIVGSCSAAVVQSLATQESVDEKTRLALDAQLKSINAASQAMAAANKSVKATASFDEVAEAEAEVASVEAERELERTRAELLAVQAQIATPEEKPRATKRAKAARVKAEELGAEFE
jgi:hypothetical protein